MATLFAGRDAKTRIRQRDWLKLADEKICRQHASRKRSYFFVCSREQIRQVENRLKETKMLAKGSRQLNYVAALTSFGLQEQYNLFLEK